MSYQASTAERHYSLDSESGPYTLQRRPQWNAPLNILLVEDEASDVLLTRSALDHMQTDYEMHTLPNGREVLPYLRRTGKYRDEPHPDILFLDLSLPGKDGFEVLTELSERSVTFGELPIVILTGDTRCTFLKQSFSLNIVAYVTKPCSPAKIAGAIAACRL